MLTLILNSEVNIFLVRILANNSTTVKTVPYFYESIYDTILIAFFFH